MERNIHDYFENETMPEELSRRIEQTLTAKPVNAVRPRWTRAAAVAASLILVLAMTFSGQITTAFAEVYDFFIHTQSPEETTPLGRMDKDTYLTYGDVIDIDEDGAILATTDPAEVRDGRLYFIANGEDIDITDLCSMDTAFIYVMQDRTGTLHYIFVGGRPDNWGYGSIMKKPGNLRNPLGELIGGGGHNHCGRESNWEPYGWYLDAKEKIGHPFPV